jgi:hypothetical protein
MARERVDRKVTQRDRSQSTDRAAHPQGADRVEPGLIARPFAGALAYLIAFIEQFELFQLLE